MKLCEKIYTLRTEKKLSQGDLAELLDVSRQSVSKWETGASIPDLDKLIKMSDLFGVSLDALVREEMPKNEEKTTENTPNPPENGENPQNTLHVEKSKAVGKHIMKHIVYYSVSAIFLIANYLLNHWFGFKIFGIWWRIPIVFMIGFLPMLIWTLYEFRAFRFFPNIKQKICFMGAWLFYLIFPIVMEIIIAFVWDGILFVDLGGWLFYVWKAVSPVFLAILLVFTAAWIRADRQKKESVSDEAT